MSVSTVIASAALLSSIAHGGTYDVTAGPAKTGANPGQTVIQKVSNHGTLPETVRVAVDEIGHSGTNGACGFKHSAPLAAPSVSSIRLNPGTEYTLKVKVAPTGPAGYHAVTVAYTTGGTGAVKVTQGVATVIGVTYPGSGADSSPCVAVAETAKPSGINPAVPGGIAASVLAAGSYLALRARRRRRSRRASGQGALS
jgi:hypothetical protein